MNKQPGMRDDFEILTAFSVEEVGTQAWDSLSGTRPFQSARWYAFGERVMEGCKPVYIILTKAGKAVARGTFWITRTEPLPVPEAIRGVLQPVFQHWPLMICRVPLLDLSGLILPADPALCSAALRLISSAARREAARHRISFILFPYLEREVSREKGWPAGFAPIDLPGPATCLQIHWPDFDTYLNQLPRSTRKYYRHNHKHASDLSIHVDRKETLAPEQVVSFIRNVEKHHKSASNPCVPAILKNTGMVEAAWFSAKIGEQPAGCLLTFKERESSLLSLIGLDYNVPGAYFQLLYSAIGFAIENHSKLLLGGTGAYQFKQSMGFELTTNTWAVLASHNPFLQKIGFFLAKWAN